MNKITIYTQILDGNLGDGWTDNYEAANALADFTRKTWENDLAEINDYEIEIEIDVERNTSGVCRDRAVFIEDEKTEDQFEKSYDFQEQIERLLTDESRLWDLFCGSDEAEKFFSED